ncbi:MAG: glycosyltransferase family 2 protein [Bacteroidia bacterium]
MTNTNPTFSISVVIPNYNGKHLLEANIPSVLEALSFIKAENEIIVVDDASTDSSVEFMKQHYPNIQLIVNASNQGFSPTINKGIFAAQHQLVLCLNSDVQLSADYFIHQLKYFEKTDTFGVIGKIIDQTDKHLQDAGKYPKMSFKGIKGSYNYIPKSLPTEIWLPTFFLSGANALIDRKKLMELGGFNELFAPFYFEDADLGVRAWRIGYKCYFEPQAVCMHALSSTIKKLQSEKVKTIIERNRILFNYLHLEGFTLKLFKCWLFMRCYSRLIIGNSTIYNAIKSVRNKEKELEKSQRALEELQKKHNKYYSVKNIESTIYKSIEGIAYQIF